MHPVKITKAHGEKEFFSKEKLVRSLRRSHVSDDVINAVVSEITSQLTEGMSTKEIFRRAFELLRQYTPPHAARYKLKQGINELGPSGFPFEQYVGALLASEGYSVKTGIILQGHCVRHEVDVIAEKDEQYVMVECKYHNAQGIHCDVKIPLYIHSRFLDIDQELKDSAEHSLRQRKMMIFTNTRFTDDAITYGNCIGIRLVGWDYPRGDSLRERVNAAGLHPLTCMTTLTNHEKGLLLEEGLVLCRQIFQKPEILGKIGISSAERQERILNESRLISALPRPNGND